MPTCRTAPDTTDRPQGAPLTVRIVDAEVNEDELTVHLEDGRSVTTPLE